MPIVRELVTVLATTFDDKGLTEYEQGIKKVKELAVGLGAAFGIAFSAEKIYEFIDGIFDTAAEVRKLQAQITNLARPTDDVTEAMGRMHEIAENVHIEFTDVVTTFRDFLKVSQESTVSQNQLLDATENIYKALRVDRTTPEEQQRFFQVIQRAEILGKAGPRVIGMLNQISHSSMLLLESYFKTNEAGVRALGKSGKITADDLIKAFSHSSDELEKKYAKLPVTIGMAFKHIRELFVDAAIAIDRLTMKVSTRLGPAIIWLADKVANFIRRFVEAVGGLENVIEVLGIALALALGPKLITMLVEATAWTWRWAAANLVNIATWAALAIAIAGVAIAIQDIVYWIQGKPSLIGTWVGSFKDLKQNFAQMDIFAGFRFFDDLMKGEWNKAFKDLQIALTDTKAICLELAAAVGAITLAFLTWKLLVQPIRGVMGALKGATTEAKLAETAVDVAGAGGATKTVAKTAAKDATKAVTKGGGFGGFLGWLGRVGTAIEIGAATINTTTGWADKTPEQEAADVAAAERQRQEWNKTHPNQRPPMFGALGRYLESLKSGFGALGGNAPEQPSSAINFTGDVVQRALQQATLMKAMPFLMPGLPAMMGVAPGALGPAAASGPVTNNTTLNQSNSITVSAALDDAGIGALVQSKITQAGNDILMNASRDFSRSSPRTEPATQ